MMIQENERKGFASYLQQKDFTQTSIVCYTDKVEKFLERSNKDVLEIGKTDILKHLGYLKKVRGLKNNSRAMHLNAMNHYFNFLYQNEVVGENPCTFLKMRGIKRKSLHRIFSEAELDQILDNYYHNFVLNYNDQHIHEIRKEHTALSRQRNVAMLSVLLYQGTTTREVDRILLDDVDLVRAKIKIRGGRRSNSRMIPLKAEQIGFLMSYLQNTRPNILNYSFTNSRKLFLPLPTNINIPTTSDNLMNTFRVFSNQVRSIEPLFTNFKQTRATAITHWLRKEGLRITQYYAGHKNINSTEEYLPNDVENLSDEIAQYHPY